tara:strand:+ start:75 stop:482 length:408 start_codon:yes stop_codon:yes gene_type:complete
MNTALYTSLLGMLWLGLTMYVILGRWKYEVSLGDGDEKDLHRRIRAHANFMETVPFAVLLLWFGEMYVLTPHIVHSMGIALVIGRVLHAYGMLFQKRSTNRFRQTGMALTMTMMGVLSVWLFVGLMSSLIEMNRI